MPGAPGAASSAIAQDPRVQRLVACYETLSPQTLDALVNLYSTDVRFKDPFNEVQGTAALRRVFEHMFKLQAVVRFDVRVAACEGDDAVLVWLYRGWREATTGSADALTLRGSTHVHFDAQGRIDVHRDYWDAAEELYETVPMLGALMRWLKRRVMRGA
jgi:steroid Delta-isomerase